MIVLAHGVLSSHSNPSIWRPLVAVHLFVRVYQLATSLQINAPFDFRLHKNERV